MYGAISLIVITLLLIELLDPALGLAPRKGTLPKRDPFTGALLEDNAPRKVVVLITGASTGIGRDTAIEFSKNPLFKVYATMRDPSKSDFVTTSLTDTQKGANLDNIVVRRMDVTDESSVNHCVNNILSEEQGRIDIVVNNAGYGMAACLEGASVQEAQKVFDVNVWGVVRVLQAALPSMRKRRAGHIINISSTSGVRGIPCNEYYTGSKFALEGIADSLRYSLASYNITVTQVNPGPVRTAFTDTYGVSEKGGRGTRPIPGEGPPTAEEPHLNYLTGLTQMVVDRLHRRMASAEESQDSEEVAKVIVHLAVMRMNTHRIEDIPFQMGTGENSQKVIEAVKREPTGWTGMYANLLRSIPKLPVAKPPGSQEEL